MSELIVGQMSPDQALLQAKFAAVYQAARQMQLRIDDDSAESVVDELMLFPSEIIELLTKDPEAE